MKKRIFYLTALLSVFLIIFSCNNNDKNNNDNYSNDNSISNDDISDDDISDDDYDDVDNVSVEDVYTKLNLSNDERKKLNTFFSNFSEVNMTPFNEQTITDNEIIHFAVYHNYINNFSRFENAGDNKIKIKKDYIDQTAEKYFGVKITTHQSSDEISYSNGYYTIEGADGESFYFSQIEDIFEVENNFYFAIVNVYVANSGWTGDYQANSDNWTEDDDPEFYEKMTAYITKTDNRYIINEYMYFKNYQTY